MGFFINEHQRFSGNATDLANLASQCTRYLQLPGDLDKINERIVRYYVAEGLVGRPERVGRDAQYGYIHLLQFLAGRFLVESGFPMQKVGPYLMTQSIHQLETLVMNRNKPNMAELLVASFQREGGEGRSRVERNLLREVDLRKQDFRKQDRSDASRSDIFSSMNLSSSAMDSQSMAMSMKSAAISRDSLDQLQSQIHHLNQSMQDQLNRIRYDMDKERARLREDLEHERLDRRKERQALQEKIDQLIAIVAKQNKEKDNE